MTQRAIPVRITSFESDEAAGTWSVTFDVIEPDPGAAAYARCAEECRER